MTGKDVVYETKPEDFNPTVDVVGCFLESGGKFLLLLRQDFKPQGNTWGIPAGAVEAGETNPAAMVREMREETGYVSKEEELTFFRTVYVRYPDFDFVYHLFSLRLTDVPEVRVDLSQHKELIWATPEEALMMELIPGQKECTKLFYGLE